MQTKEKVQYFYGCESIEDVKQRYKKLAKTLHPDLGGSHEQFIELKGQYDNIIEHGLTHDHGSLTDMLTKKYGEKFTEPTTHITPEELNKLKADNHFNKLRALDHTYDIIDTILEQAKTEKLKILWIFQEVSKLLELDLNHFKYTTYKTNMSPSVAHQLYKKYLGI